MFTLQTAHTAAYVDICELALNCYPLVYQDALQSQHKRVGEYCASDARFLPKWNPYFLTDFGLEKKKKFVDNFL